MANSFYGCWENPGLETLCFFDLSVIKVLHLNQFKSLIGNVMPLVFEGKTTKVYSIEF